MNDRPSSSISCGALGLDARVQVAPAEAACRRAELLDRSRQRPRQDPGEDEARGHHRQADQCERQPARAGAGVDLAERRRDAQRADHLAAVDDGNRHQQQVLAERVAVPLTDVDPAAERGRELRPRRRCERRPDGSGYGRIRQEAPVCVDHDRARALPDRGGCDDLAEPVRGAEPDEVGDSPRQDRRVGDNVGLELGGSPSGPR